jgi:salicylate hydroxylase
VDARVYEQATVLREVGAGIQLAPNATRLLHRLGVADRLAPHAVRPAAIEMRAWDSGDVLMRNTLGAACEEMYGAPYYCVHRADLHRALVESLPAGALSLGVRCVGVRERDDDVVLDFADGSSVAAGLVVGADGVHSALRARLVADQPRFSGQTAYRGLVPAERVDSLLREPKVAIWLGPGRHFVCYPVSAGRLVSFVATSPAEDWRTESWRARGEVGDLLADYRDWHPEVRGVLAAADEVGRWALHDRDPVHTWSSGRITLVGDAAHPMLPFGAQGAALAIEDAAALAACLRAASADALPEALRWYETARKPRAIAVYEYVRANARNHHYADGEKQRARDGAMEGNWGLRGQEWLFGYDAEREVEPIARPV